MRGLTLGLLLTTALTAPAFAGDATYDSIAYEPQLRQVAMIPEPGMTTKPNVGGGGGYTGPGDTAVGALTDCWGAQLCHSGYSGMAANVCLVSSFSTCADVNYDRTGTPGSNANYGGLLVSGTNSLTASPLSCSGDTTCLIKVLYSNYSTGCNLTASGSTLALPVLMTSTDNGHVSVGIASAAGGMPCTEGSQYVDGSILRITNMDTSFNNLAYGAIQTSTTANEIYLRFLQSPSNSFVGGWQDDSSTRHETTAINYTPTTSLACFAVNAKMSATSALAELIVGSTVTSDVTSTGAVSGSGNSVINNANAAVGEQFIEGRQPIFAIVSPHLSSGNAQTVLGNMKQFWTGSGC